MTQEQPTQEEIQKRMQMMKDNCIFCKIIKKEIPAQTIFEDDICLAILDINPASKGHILLMPKEHYMMMPMVPDQVLGHMSIMSKYISDLIKKTFPDSKDTTVFIANGAAAGQQSQHFMSHLIPRYDNDNINFDVKGAKLNQQELKTLAEKFQAKLVEMNSGQGQK
ncbi:MAG: HIT domain-containing protein [Nanoarchaeales archaeon]|nr:HIT domain-containing protein [Nanoarchaeales archaeon]